MNNSAKCIECRVTFDQGKEWNKRMCDKCIKEDKIRRHEEAAKRGIKKQTMKISLERKSIIRKCRFCSNLVNAYYGRLYCSNTCRTKFNNMQKDILRTKDRIIRLQGRIKVWEKKLNVSSGRGFK